MHLSASSFLLFLKYVQDLLFESMIILHLITSAYDSMEANNSNMPRSNDGKCIHRRSEPLCWGDNALGSKLLVVHYVADDCRHSIFKCLSYLGITKVRDRKKGISLQRRRCFKGTGAGKMFSVTSLEI
jgi:hypothetical protein